MQSLLKNKNFILALVSFFAISSAAILELFFDVMPCKLCKIGQYFYLTLLCLSLLNLRYKLSFLLNIITPLILLAALGFSFYHLLIDLNILSSTCASQLNYASSDQVLHLKDVLELDAVAPCNIGYKIFGVSLVLINFMIMLLLNICYYLYSKLINKKS